MSSNRPVALETEQPKKAFESLSEFDMAIPREDYEREDAKRRGSRVVLADFI
jgi:hypothetical protein